MELKALDKPLYPEYFGFQPSSFLFIICFQPKTSDFLNLILLFSIYESFLLVIFSIIFKRFFIDTS